MKKLLLFMSAIALTATIASCPGKKRLQTGTYRVGKESEK